MHNTGHHFPKTIFRSSLSYLSFPVVSVVKSLPANAGDAEDMSSIPGQGRSSEGGNGNSLWYSSLGNPMDRGVWWATVYGVKKSWTQLSDWACMHARTCLPLPISWFCSALLSLTFVALMNTLADWKKLHGWKLRVIFHLAGLLRIIARDSSLSGSSEWLFPRGKGGARVYRSFRWKQMNNMWLNIKRLMLIAHKNGHLMLKISMLFYVWGRCRRVWAYWNYSLDMHLNYLEPVSCFSPTWIPLKVHHQGWLPWLMAGWPQHRLFAEMAGEVLCTHSLGYLYTLSRIKNEFQGPTNPDILHF